MRIGHLAIAGSFALLGTVMVTSAAGMPTIAHIDYGPGLFPTIVGWLMIIMGALAAFDAMRMPAAVPAEMPEGEAPAQPPNYVLFGAFLLAPLVYVAAANPIGFLPTMAFIVGMLAWLASGRVVASISLGVGLSVALYIIFYLVLRVTLPWGVLLPFAGMLTWR